MGNGVTRKAGALASGHSYADCRSKRTWLRTFPRPSAAPNKFERNTTNRKRRNTFGASEPGPVAQYSNATPRMLIGLEHAHLGAPIATRTGPVGSPIACKTKAWMGGVRSPQGPDQVARVGHIHHWLSSGRTIQSAWLRSSIHYWKLRGQAYRADHRADQGSRQDCYGIVRPEDEKRSGVQSTVYQKEIRNPRGQH